MKVGISLGILKAQGCLAAYAKLADGLTSGHVHAQARQAAHQEQEDLLEFLVGAKRAEALKALVAPYAPQHKEGHNERNNQEENDQERPVLRVTLEVEGVLEAVEIHTQKR